MDSSRLVKPIRATQKPLLLKDHLLDDMSSCSSNGFKSFPRRQCCTTVRFLHEFDRKNKQQQRAYVDLKKAPSKSALSALQSVITAVRRLPFVAAKSPEKRNSSFNSFLPRSFSKKIFKKGSFWKRKPEQKEIERWKTFDQLLKEEPLPSDCAITTTDDRESYSWSGGGDSPSAEEVKNDDVVVPVEAVSDGGVGATNDDVSMESTTCSDGSSDTNSSSTETKKQWSSDQEKEQFSPVSVLDCPFDDDDEVSSPFQHRLARMEGTRKKLLKKIQKFECLAKLEPVNLTNRFSSEPDSDNESSTSLDEEDEEEEDEDEEKEEEEEALKLLDQMKCSINISSHGHNLKADKLLLDFFRERIASDQQHYTSVDRQRGASSFHDALMEIAEDWINGAKPRETGWEEEKNRQAYVEDMEKCGAWRRIDQEKEEVVLELGNEVFDSLLNEVLLDITS